MIDSRRGSGTKFAVELHIDLRPVDILRAIGGLEKYLDLVEAQFEEVHRIERHTLELQRPADADDWNELNYLDDLYERDLKPAMRYSFVVLVHIVFETQLRDFCSRIQRDLKLPEIAVTDLRGGAIDQALIFLTRLAGIRAQDFPEWQQLRTLQKVRDCIIHAYGHVAESRDEKFLRCLATQGDAVSIDDEGRITVTKAFCERQLITLRTLFNRLFLCVGWNP